jgi:CHASE1-domain containing sensor protein
LFNPPPASLDDERLLQVPLYGRCRSWFKNYPPNVPHDVQPEQYRSLVHLLEEAFPSMQNALFPSAWTAG